MKFDLEEVNWCQLLTSKSENQYGCQLLDRYSFDLNLREVFQISHICRMERFQSEINFLIGRKVSRNRSANRTCAFSS